MSIRIVLADDRCLFSEALARSLDSVPDFDIAGFARQRHEVLPMVRSTAAKVVVMGEGVLEEAGDLATEIRSQLPQCGIAVISDAADRPTVRRLVRISRLRVVPANCRLPQLIHAIRDVDEGCPAPGPYPSQGSAHGGCLRSLNDRELEIMRSTMTGASVKEIARELFLAPGTVRNLASSAIRKLAARNRFDAARIAKEQGLL